MPTPRNLFILSLIFSLILPWPLAALAENRYYDPGSKEELCGDELDQDGNGQAETLSDCACPEQVTTEEFTKIRSFITGSQLILIQRKDDHSQDAKYFPWDKTGKNNLFCPLTDALLYYLYQELAKITPSKTTTSKFYYFHNDHLSGTTAVTDEQGNLVETRDYYPYGEDRPLSKTAESIPPLPPNQPPKFDSPTKNIPATPYGFTGKEQDTESGLHYFGSRFYSAAIGRFTQQDPAFLAVGTPDLKKITGLELKDYLADPQSTNSYSYARNNPLRYNDPKGEFLPLAVFAGYAAISWIAASGIAISAPLVYGQARSYIEGNHKQGDAFGEAAMTTYALAEAAISTVLAPLFTLEEAISYRLFRPADNNTNEETAQTQKSIKISPSIKINDDALEHINKKHIDRSGYLDASKFNPNEDITKLIKSGVQKPMILQEHGTYRRTFDVGRNIGLDKNTGQQTSTVTIITDSDNNLITAYPGN